MLGLTPEEGVKPDETTVPGTALTDSLPEGDNPLEITPAKREPLAPLGEPMPGTPQGSFEARSQGWGGFDTTRGESFAAGLRSTSAYRGVMLALDRMADRSEKFPHDPNFNLESFLETAPVLLSDNDRTWMRRRNPKSEDEAENYLSMIQYNREQAALVGQNPVFGFGGMILDPTYWVSGAVPLGIVRALNTSRRVAAMAGAVGEVGAVQFDSLTRPVEPHEAVLAALIGAGAVGAFHRPSMDIVAGNLQRAGFAKTPAGRAIDQAQLAKAIERDTADYLKRLDETEWNIQRVTSANSDLVQVPKYEPIQVDGRWGYYPSNRSITETLEGARDVGGVRREIIDGGIVKLPASGQVPLKQSAWQMLTDVANSKAVNPLIRSTARQLLDMGGDNLKVVPARWGAKDLRPNEAGAYRTGKHAVQVAATGPGDRPRGVYFGGQTANHEALHALTFWKYELGKRASPETAHGRLARRMESLFNDARRAAQRSGLSKQDHGVQYAFSNPHEFMAQLYTGHEPLYKFLRGLKVPSKHLDKFEPNLLGEMYDTMRRMLGMDLEDANALTRALDLTEDLARMRVQYEFGYTGGGISMIPKKVSLETPTATAPTPVAVQNTVREVNQMASVAGETLGRKIAWNTFKELEGFNPEIARTWVSDPLRSNAGNNIAASRRAIRQELLDPQVDYHTELRGVLRGRGIRSRDWILNPRKAMEAQRQLEREVMEILTDWEAKSRAGVTITEGTSDAHRVARAYDRLMQTAGQIGERAGIFQNGLLTGRGYFPRRFDAFQLEGVIERVMQSSPGTDRESALNSIAVALGRNFRSTTMDAKTRQIVARAVLDRAVRTAEGTDLGFRGHMGLDAVITARDLMKRQGMSQNEIQKVLDIMEGKVREGGKSSYQKQRLDLDMAGDLVLPSGERVPVADLIDSNLSSIAEHYVNDLSGRAAMAEFGIMDAADIAKQREALIKSIKNAAGRKKAGELFDNIVNDTLGRPVGETMHEGLRYLAAFAQMTGLRSVGFWQVTEFAPLMQRYAALHGLPRMLKEVFGSFAGGTKLLSTPDMAKDMASILSRNSYNDLFMRPFINRLEDGHLVDNANVRLHGTMQAQQFVYVANGMRYIQRRQAVASANLVTHTLEQAAKGHAKSREFLRQFGFDDALLHDVNQQFQKHGRTLGDWDAAVRDRIRSPLQTLMDEDVLRARTGEIPSIAQFSSVGRTLFTFRSFVLGAHNKILASRLANDGIKATAILMAYQMALSGMMVQLANMSGRGEMLTDYGDWANRTFAMMGGAGLLPEIVGILTGENKQFGAPVLLAADQAYRIGNALGAGRIGDAAESAAMAVPLVGLLPGYGAAVKYAFGD